MARKARVKLARRANGLSLVSEDSSLKTDMPPTFRKGRMNMPRATIPMPPSQQRTERQSRMPRGWTSSPEITVEPVVVIPETDSNTAWAKLMLYSARYSRMAPTSENDIGREHV